MAGMSAIARAGCAVLVVCLIAGCHGGGDGVSSGGIGGQQFIVSPSNLSFSAATLASPTPPARNVLATVTGVTPQTLFIRVVVTGDAVASVDNITILGPTQARMTVHPASPGVLGTGNHASVITVVACTTQTNCPGPQLATSPATIDVAYQVGAVTPPPQGLAPSVGAAGVAAEVVLRGSGFLPVTSVSFGGTPAVEFTVMSDTEIRATYPATLAAGAQVVSLNGGAVPFSQSLTLVPPGTLASATLAYPAAPQNLRGLAFDAANQALFVGVGSSTPANNQVLRYAFTGGAWQVPPLSVTVPNLRDFTLSLDGSRLLTITDTAVVELNPATLASQATTPRTTNGSTTPDSFLKGIVATNDGQAFIVSTSASFSQHWLYAVAARTFSVPLFDTYVSPEIGGPDNGTRAVLVQGGATAVKQYSAFTGLVSTTSLALAHFHPVAGRVENINLPVFDRSGNRMLVAGVSGGVFHAVYDANFGELGRVPSGDLTATTAAYAISPDATRAYVLQIGPGVCRVRAFNLVTPPGPGAQFTEVTATGFPINLLPNCPAGQFDTPIRLLLNPPGDTLFIAGNQSIRVARLP